MSDQNFHIPDKGDPSHLGNDVHEITESILGQKITEHPLVVNNPKVVRKLKEVKCLAQVCGILDMLHLQQHGRSKFPKGIKFKRK